MCKCCVAIDRKYRMFVLHACIYQLSESGKWMSFTFLQKRHYPKQTFTIVTDTPENLRLKQQSELQSQVNSHANDMWFVWSYIYIIQLCFELFLAWGTQIKACWNKRRGTESFIDGGVGVLIIASMGLGVMLWGQRGEKQGQLSTLWCAGGSPQLLHLAANMLPTPYCGQPNPGILTDALFCRGIGQQLWKCVLCPCMHFHLWRSHLVPSWLYLHLLLLFWNINHNT